MSAELLPRLKSPLIIWSKFASKTPKPTSSGFDQKYLESSRIQIKKIVQAVLSCNHWCWLQCALQWTMFDVNNMFWLPIFYCSAGMYSGVHHSAFLFLVCCSHTCWKAAMGKQLMSKYKASWAPDADIDNMKARFPCFHNHGLQLCVTVFVFVCLCTYSDARSSSNGLPHTFTHQTQHRHAPNHETNPLRGNPN